MPAKKTATIFDLQGKPVGKTKLPDVFETPLRPDVIKRAVLAIQSRRLQPQGRDPMAGKKTSAESRGTGMGIARIPRVKGGGGRGAAALYPFGGVQPCAGWGDCSRLGDPAGRGPGDREVHPHVSVPPQHRLPGAEMPLHLR